MLTLRRANPLLFTLCTRHYAAKKKAGKMATYTSNIMVHQETLRYVNPLARVNVQTDIELRVEPVDVHQYTNADVFIAQLCGDVVKNCSATLKVEVTPDDKEVNVLVKKVQDKSNFICDLKIPLRAELHIDAKDVVRVKGVFGETLNIKALSHVQTREIRATQISLISECGSIHCDGTLLAKCAQISTQDGQITLDKLTGDNLYCSTTSGNIQTSCCYVEQSKFKTESGCLNLNNVHKECQVTVLQGGKLHMAGVHGCLHVEAQGGSMQLQLSKLHGKSTIIAKDQVAPAVINISDEIEKTAYIEVSAKQIVLDEALNHCKHALKADLRHFRLSNDKEPGKPKLLIRSTGGVGVQLGKQSWADIMRNSFKSK